MTAMGKMVCIVCPIGCRMDVVTDGSKLVQVAGNGCKRGITYAEKEITNPTRMLTTTVKVLSGVRPVVAVKSNRELPKDRIFNAMEVIKRLAVKAPVNRGQVLLENLLDTGADVIATWDVEEIKDE